MKDCFHRECDAPQSLPNLESSWKFLSKITQALVLSIFELTMPSETFLKCTRTDKTPEQSFGRNLTSIKQDFVKKKPTMEKIIDTNSNDLKSENLVIQAKNYQPNNGGVQFNIENLHINDLTMDSAGIFQKSKPNFDQSNPDLVLLMQAKLFILG